MRRQIDGSLLVVIDEPLSEWERKGEILPSYFNPGELFARVEVVLLNADRPSPALVRTLVGGVDHEVYNVPVPARVTLRTLGLQPALLARLLAPAETLGARLRPALVRSYGHLLSAFGGMLVARGAAAPHVVSVHTNPDTAAADGLRGALGPLRRTAERRAERMALRGADRVVAVYGAVLPYLERLGVQQPLVIYNLLNGGAIRPKADYAARGPLRVLSVGQQSRGKTPFALVEAAAAVPQVKLVVVGTGPEHAALVAAARRLALSERVRFLERVPNMELCAMLPEFDVFALQTRYFEFPKALMEPMLAGLPCVVNVQPGGRRIPELADDRAVLVPDSAHGYADGLRRLAQDEALRRALGTSARQFALECFSPASVKQSLESLYLAMARR